MCVFSSHLWLHACPFCYFIFRNNDKFGASGSFGLFADIDYNPNLFHVCAFVCIFMYFLFYFLVAFWFVCDWTDGCTRTASTVVTLAYYDVHVQNKIIIYCSNRSKRYKSVWTHAGCKHQTIVCHGVGIHGGNNMACSVQDARNMIEHFVLQFKMTLITLLLLLVIRLIV